MIAIQDLKVRDVMTPAPYCLEESCHLDCAYELLNARGLSGAPVLGPNGELVGVLTIRDLVRLAGGILTPDHEPSAEDRARLKNSTVGDHILRGPVTCPDDVSLVEACKMMIKERLHRLVVTEFGVPIGILSSIDVTRTVACLDETQRDARDELRHRDRSEDPSEVMNP
jgi:CBS domain-containing protein